MQMICKFVSETLDQNCAENHFPVGGHINYAFGNEYTQYG